MKTCRLILMIAGLAATAPTGLAGCTTGGNAAPCGFAACGVDAVSLKLVTARQLELKPGQVAVLHNESQFAGAVLVWRATASGKTYDCREGRDARTGAVHYVECRVADGEAALKAFP